MRLAKLREKNRKLYDMLSVKMNSPNYSKGEMNNLPVMSIIISTEQNKQGMKFNSQAHIIKIVQILHYSMDYYNRFTPLIPQYFFLHSYFDG